MTRSASDDDPSRGRMAVNGNHAQQPRPAPLPPLPSPDRVSDRLVAWLQALGPGGEAALVAALALAMFIAGTSLTPLMDRDEARFSEASREMLAARDLVVPTFAGVNRYDKPILIYWCTMASYAAFGVNEGAARLPSNLAGALTVLLVAWVARRRWGEGAGLLAGLLCATSFVFWMEAKAATADMVLLLPTLAVMLAFERLINGEARPLHAGLFWTALALAVLAKGPIAPAWVLMTALALWAMGRRWRPWELVLASVLALLGWWRLGPTVLLVPLLGAGFRLLRSATARQVVRRMRLTWGLPLFATLTLPWAVAAQLRTNGEFLRRAIGHHVVERSLAPFESHGGFPLFYLLTALVAALPWLPVVAEALGWPGGSLREDPRWRFLVAWLLGPLVLIELVQTKLVHYWLPSYPAAVLLASWWVFRERCPPRPADTMARWLLLVGGSLTALLPAVLVGRLRLPGLTSAAVASGLVMATATVLAAAWWRRRRWSAVITLGVGTGLFLTLVELTFLPGLGWRQLGPRSARRVVAERGDGETIVLYRPRDDELYFYLPLDVVTCRSSECLMDWCRGGAPFLGLARAEELERFQAEHRECRLAVPGVLEGLDLAHGKWARSVLFRGPPPLAGGGRREESRDGVKDPPASDLAGPVVAVPVARRKR